MKSSIETRNIKSNLEQGLGNIRTMLEGVSEKNFEKEAKKILNKYGIDEGLINWDELKLGAKEKGDSKLKKGLFTAGKAALVAGAALALVVYNGIKQSGNRNKEQDIELVKPKQPEPKPDTPKEDIKKEEPHPRFDIEMYNQLPEKGKEVYVYMAEYNPNIGMGYEMLDKTTALLYIFDKDNKLKAKVPAGYGRHLGDKKNTSYVLNGGIMTTPAGGYITKRPRNQSNIKEYGGLGFSLDGITIEGDSCGLGVHPIYPNEYEQRKAKMDDNLVANNALSNGCVNLYGKDITNLEAGQIFVVLPDKASTAEFKMSNIAKSLMPGLIEFINNQTREFENVLTTMKTVSVREKTQTAISELKARIAHAEEILAGK